MSLILHKHSGPNGRFDGIAAHEYCVELLPQYYLQFNLVLVVLSSKMYYVHKYL